MLPGKTDKNPRTEHYNAIEQPFAETVLGTEENTEQSASSGATTPSEPAETAPVRVYVPKVPYPIPPKHLMDPISAEQLAGFRKMGEIKEVLDGDPHTDTKKLSGNVKVWRRLKSLRNRHEEKSKDWKFPLKNNPRSSLTVDPTRNSQTIVLDNYGNFHIFQRFSLVADSTI
ncbi:hypothetical protein F2Q70_00030616 [Brassica cretica]|uniref:Uncharacterized protein n=1 Tax=Brassica cretica TaxID=69181 RepID=A0A8S9FEK3_BRACR|nr:hypothetical protein F2Q70_00030616 [Brassica cretica]